MNRDVGGYPDRDDGRSRVGVGERKEERRDRPNRWSDRDLDPIERREREKTLNDRLQQMAMPNETSYSNHDRPPARVVPPEMDEPPDMHPNMIDRRMYPPHKGPPPPPMNPEMDDMYGGMPPPDEYDRGPPPLIDDYPPPMMHDRHPDDWMEGGPPMHPRMHRDDYEHERFGRGRRDFRDKFEPRGRGPPGPDYYPPPRDGGFGPPRGMMRGGPDFAPPQRGGPMMRGGGPHKFHPRGGPPMRGGPRPNPPWKDRQNYGPRFDHPDFHRGPPGMYDDSPHMRRGGGGGGGGGGRFDDRRRGRHDYGHDGPPPPPPPENDRFQKRSRWGESHEENVPAVEAETDRAPPNDGETKGGHTPLHDEPFNRDVVEGGGEQKEEEEEEPVVEEAAPVQEQVEESGEQQQEEVAE